MKIFARLCLCLASILLLLFIMTSCKKENHNRVIIYSCLESFRNQDLLEQLQKDLPDINVNIQSLSTGKVASKLKAEGTNCEGDIIIGLDTAYSESLKEYYEHLTDYDNSHYLEEFKIPGKEYAVWERYGGCVVVNTALLSEKGLPEPQSYNDLLKPEYKNLIVMPDPKSSGTGYLFLENIVNNLGEEEAFNYFDQLVDNIIFFTASGSGPVKLLIQGEAAIGLGLTFTIVQEINNGMPFKVIYFEEGSPYNTSSMAMLKDRKNAAETKIVFDYLYQNFIFRDKTLFSPEPIFNEQQITIPNYPASIKYGNMAGINDITRKENLLKHWRY
ncbi:MAG: extracellular solute-binding protein [Eubacterium sp.]